MARLTYVNHSLTLNVTPPNEAAVTRSAYLVFQWATPKPGPPAASP